MTDRMEMVGVILEHSRDIFRVGIEGTEQIVTAKLSGKMRLNKIDLQVGDRVKIEVSPYDMSMGRIVFRINSARDIYSVRDENTNVNSARRREKRTNQRFQSDED
ncbi:translation initiation factor IF-1 [bacterium]|jgi:translation initiation factor IF-1|nr:translation initiation factor IF-1 [Candidatus Elulimicrobium humile]